MLPTIPIFGRTIAMYGLMIVLGLLTGLAVIVFRSKRYHILREDALFASIFGGIGLFIGAKLLYLLTIIPNLITYHRLFLSKPSLFLSFLNGGFVYYGGFIGAAIGLYIYCKKFHVNFLTMFDLVVPSIPLIHAIGRLGCYFTGCCYGIPYNGPGHVIFHISPSAPNEIALFPTQPLESGLNLIACLLLLLYARPEQKPGKVLGIYITYYAILRFLIEFFRGDGARGILIGISTSQWISLALIPFGLWLLIFKNKLSSIKS